MILEDKLNKLLGNLDKVDKNLDEAIEMKMINLLETALQNLLDSGQKTVNIEDLIDAIKGLKNA